MKQKILYVCEFCEAGYLEKEKCETCEAEHYGITRKEYLDWRMLNKEAAEAGKQIGCCNTEKTRANFDKAIERLVKYEETHRIDPHCKKPTDFYY